MSEPLGPVRVVVLTNPRPRSGHPGLYKFVRTLVPLSERIWVITGGLSETSFQDSEVCVKIENISFNVVGDPMWLRILKHVAANVRILVHFAQVVRRVDTVAFFYAFEQLVPMLLAKLFKKKTIVVMTSGSHRNSAIIHKGTFFGLGDIIFPYLTKVLERASCALADCIIVFSSTYVELFDLQQYEHKVHQAGLYVDTELFRESRNIKDRKSVIGYVGRLAKVKGVMDLVGAMELLVEKRGDLHFLIGGDGPLMTQIEQKIRECGISSYVSLPGWIPNEMLVDRLNELRLLVLPSHGEGVPSILLEAMACGTPVLATPVGHVPFLIQDGETGFILRDNSPEGIAEKVLQVLANPQVGNVAKNARQFIQENYSYWPIVERYRSILKSTIGEGK